MYTDDYYLTNCHGFEDFVISNGRKVGPRFIKALSLAGDLSGKRVLDVGSGRGELVIQSAMRGADAYGIDYAQAAVDIANRALSSLDAGVRERTNIQQMDVKALQFEDGFFDVVFMMDVVEHLYPHELSAAFDELRRTIRPGGVLVMHTSPNKIFEGVVASGGIVQRCKRVADAERRNSPDRASNRAPSPAREGFGPCSTSRSSEGPRASFPFPTSSPSPCSAALNSGDRPSRSACCVCGTFAGRRLRCGDASSSWTRTSSSRSSAPRRSSRRR